MKWDRVLQVSFGYLSRFEVITKIREGADFAPPPGRGLTQKTRPHNINIMKPKPAQKLTIRNNTKPKPVPKQTTKNGSKLKPTLK